MSSPGLHLPRRRLLWSIALGLSLRGAAAPGADPPSNAGTCARIVHADVVALDQAVVYNRFGTVVPGGMLFALRRDVVSNVDCKEGQPLKAGAVTLREGKRPRPIVLRANEGDCLEICFTNLLAPAGSPKARTKTRAASVHVQGLEVVDELDADDGSWVGNNASSLIGPATAPLAAAGCAPGESATYRLYARAEGVYYLTSSGVEIAAPNQVASGLFGMVVVEPRGSAWYRSQVTADDLKAARAKGVFGPHGHPVIDYDAAGPDGRPVLKMTRRVSAGGRVPTLELCRSDLTAVITGPDEPGEDRWLFRPSGHRPGDNPLYPRTWQPYREFAIIYHDMAGQQAPFNLGGMQYTLAGAGEAFAINYGSVAIGTEVWANRMKVGPAADAVDAKFEEFFLSSWVGGDPAVIVDVPANATGAATPGACSGPSVPSAPTPTGGLVKGPKATAAFFPDDPSNVYHSYLNDRVKFRILHGGGNVVHVHHQHAHQWLKTPASHESKLLDSQTITPGDGFTLEMIYGSGNRNLTPGDSIFHCHFYPHFAGGLWAVWRVHDVFEAGTEMETGSDGIPRPAVGSRALPDGEIGRGTPIPAVVPMPTLPMAPVPPAVRIAAGPDPGPGPAVPPGRRVELVYPDRDAGRNPGYPFFIPGVAGRRAPQPPMDFARGADGRALDGGLPRHVVLGTKDPAAEPYHQENIYDFSRDFYATGADGSVPLGPGGKPLPLPILAQELPEDGTPLEQAAMRFQEQGVHPTDRPDGQPDEFVTNGGKAPDGAPFADPIRNAWNERLRRREAAGTIAAGDRAYLAQEEGRNPDPATAGVTRYKAADIQLDVVFNKKGWHYPQQRIASLWEDVKDVLARRRRPEPLFVRANSGGLVEYWLTNLLPGYYELDDFQVRTPTDIVGQHIHLVKFDVLSSDGASNGWNYQDGSYGPDEVRSRIDAINAGPGLYAPDPSKPPRTLKAVATPFFGPGDGGAWVGAQTTVQLWYADRLLTRDTPVPGNPGVRSRREDRTLQSVFTHDHFGPTTHQQVGLYAAMIIEPHGSRWYDNETAAPLGGRDDGGPTSWQAMIEPPAFSNIEPPFREFILEFQDFQLAYDRDSNGPAKPYQYYKVNGPSTPTVPPWGWIDAAFGAARHAVAPPLRVTTPPAPQPVLISGFPEPGGRVVNYRSEPIPFRVGVAKATPNPSSSDPSDLAQAYRSIKRDDDRLNAQPGGDTTTKAGTPFPGGFLGAGPYDPYTPLLRAYEHDRIHIRALVGAHHEGHVFNIQGVKWPAEPHEPNSGYRSNQVMSISEHFEMNFKVPVTDPGGGRTSSDYLYQASADVNGVPQGLWGLLRAYRRPEAGLARFREGPTEARLAAAAAQIRGFLDPTKTTLKVRKYTVVAVPRAITYNDRNGNAVTDPNGLAYVLEADLNKANPGPLVIRACAGELIALTLKNELDATKPPFAATPRLFQGGGKLAFSTTNPPIPANTWTATSSRVGLHPQVVSFDVNTSNGFNAGNNPVQTVKPGEQKYYAWYAGAFHVDEASGQVTPRPVEFGTVGLAPADPMFQHTHGLLGVLVVEPQGATWDDAARTTALVSLPGAGSFREFVMALQDQVDTPGNPPAVNYKNEPMTQRFNVTALNLATLDVAGAVSSTFKPDGTHPIGDPQTPIFAAVKGEPVRFRLVHTGGGAYWSWAVHGHSWQRSPYRANSTVLGPNPLSEWTGNVGPTGPLDQADVLIDGAGGRFAIPGDYLYRNVSITQLQNGMWGLFRVVDDKSKLP